MEEQYRIPNSLKLFTCSPFTDYGICVYVIDQFETTNKYVTIYTPTALKGFMSFVEEKAYTFEFNNKLFVLSSNERHPSIEFINMSFVHYQRVTLESSQL